MPQIRPEFPGVARTAGWAPVDDPAARRRRRDPGALYGAGRWWTPFGLTVMDHDVGVDPATGGVTVSAIDVSIDYHSGWLRAQRMLNVQEQHAQRTYLEAHPNTDPRPHLFANWQFQREAHVSAVWGSTCADLLVM